MGLRPLHDRVVIKRLEDSAENLETRNRAAELRRVLRT